MIALLHGEMPKKLSNLIGGLLQYGVKDFTSWDSSCPGLTELWFCANSGKEYICRDNWYRAKLKEFGVPFFYICLIDDKLWALKCDEDGKVLESTLFSEFLKERLYPQEESLNMRLLL